MRGAFNNMPVFLSHSAIISLRRYSWLGWLSALVLPAYVMLQEPFLSYENLPFPTLAREVAAGHPIPLLVRRCNHTSSTQTYMLTHTLDSLDGGNDIILPAFPVQLRPGCTEGISLVNEIPVETPPGRYRVVGSAEVKGVLRTFTVDWSSIEFKVLPRNDTSKPEADQHP